MCNQTIVNWINLHKEDKTMNMRNGNTPLIKIKYKYNDKEDYIYTKLEYYN